jgi:hypothetical protein
VSSKLKRNLDETEDTIVLELFKYDFYTSEEILEEDRGMYINKRRRNRIFFVVTGISKNQFEQIRATKNQLRVILEYFILERLRRIKDGEF